MTKELKTISRSLIFLKASTIALGIVLAVSFIALLLVKSRIKTPDQSQQLSNCQNFLKLKVSGEINQILTENNDIIVLTKPNLKTKKQEIIKIDSRCLKVINQIEINY